MGMARPGYSFDKAPIFDGANILRRDSSYPIDVDIACTVVRHIPTDDGGRTLISTIKPWGIETEEGQHEFIMKPDQVHSRRDA
jgi:hypothetical protein